MGPQSLRPDAQVTPPTFMDNRAQIQQLQSVAATNNNLIQNTSDGQVARANVMGNMGRLFDPINSSNGQTNNQNVQIQNGYNQYRDGVMNQNNANNINTLGRFIGENDMYRANLSKEKQLRFNDTIQQGQNMTNNMQTMAAILQKTPNYNVTCPFWNPSFRSGVPNQDLLTNNGQSDGDSYDANLKKIDDLVTNKGWDRDTAIEFVTGASGYSRTKNVVKTNGQGKVISNTNSKSSGN